MNKWNLRTLLLCCALIALTAATAFATDADSGMDADSGLTPESVSQTAALASGAEIVNSGYCGGEGDGTNLTWTLDSEGTLTISGAGKMRNYTYSNNAPWGERIITVSISHGVTSLGDRAFYGCSGLTNVTIPDGVTSLGEQAFYDCSGLTSVTIPDSVTSIGTSAFGGCSGLTNVTIPDGVTSIGGGAFAKCSGLTSVTIPDSVTFIEEGTFYWSGLTSVTISDSVIGIKNRAFEGCTSLKDITLPDGMTHIGELAFSGCSALTSVTIPKSVSFIGRDAFVNCRSLTSAGPIGGGYSYEFPWTKSIPDNAFSGCSGLTSVTIPESVTFIRDNAFKGCSNLTSVTIPNSVTSIGNNAFEGCSNLTSVTIPNSVTSISSWAFSNCRALTSVIIPESVTLIGDWAFSNCRALTSVIIPDSVTYISDRVFDSCSGLTSVTIPDSVTSIPANAFTGCTSLKDIFYSGSEEEWKRIKGYYNIPSIAVIHYNAEIPDSNQTPPAPIVLSSNKRANSYDIQLADGYGDIVISAWIPGREDLSKEDIAWKWEKNGNSGSYDYSESGLFGTWTLKPSQGGVRASLHVVSREPERLTITVSVKDGRYANCTVVSSYPVQAGKPSSGGAGNQSSDPFYIAFGDYELTVGKSESVDLFLYSQNADEQDLMKTIDSIEWTSSNPAVIAFDKNGTGALTRAGANRSVWDQFLGGNDIDAVTFHALSSGESTVTCTVKIGQYAVRDTRLITAYSKENKELLRRITNWRTSYDNYMKALEAVLLANTKQPLSIEEQAKLLAEEDKNSSQPLVNFLPFASGDQPKVRDYVYLTVAHYLSEKTVTEFNFGKIDVSGVDAASIGASIVKKVCGGINSKPYSMNFEDGKRTVTVTIGGFSSFGADFREIDYCGDTNDNLEHVAQLIAKEENVRSIIAAYVDDLMKLSRSLTDQAYQELVKELFPKEIGSLIDEDAKKLIIQTLEKYETVFSKIGAGDVVRTVKGCIGYYSYVKKIMKQADASPDSLLSAFTSMKTFEIKKELITDKTLIRAAKKITEATKSVNDWMEKYLSDDGVVITTLKDIYKYSHEFQCPVNISVYDSSGTQIGYVGEDDLWYNGDTIYIEQYGDAKTVYSKGGKLSFAVTGTGNGTLNCMVEEFDAGEPVGRVNYYDIPLYEGKSIKMEVTGTSAVAETVSITSDGSAIIADEVLTAEEYASANVQIQCFASDENGGEILGAGSYTRGDSVTLQTVTGADYMFLGWQNSGGALVSVSPVYEFTAREDVQLTALFADLSKGTVSRNVSITELSIVNSQIHALVRFDSAAQLTSYCAMYNSSGKMLDMRIDTLESDVDNILTFPVSASEVTLVKIIILNDAFVPQCEVGSIQIQ